MAHTSVFVASPVGELLVLASDAGVTGVWFPGRAPESDPGGLIPSSRPGADERPGVADAHLAAATTQLTEYFAGTRETFDLTLDPHGTDFELRVWAMLREIPYGVTTSYGVLARRLGDATLSRAVGAANGKNPIPIVVPCHRVIGARGELVGFGGGIDRKRWLLEHEGVLMRLGA